MAFYILQSSHKGVKRGEEEWHFTFLQSSHKGVKRGEEEWHFTFYNLVIKG